MNKYISVSKDGIEKLRSAFKIDGKKIGERCVKNALTFRQNNELARRIRNVAIKEYGGCTYCVGPEAECFFDSDGCMHKVLPNGAEIYLDKQTGEGKIYHEGRVVRRYETVPVSMIAEMEQVASALR